MHIMTLGDVGTAVSRAYTGMCTMLQVPQVITNLKLSPEISDFGILVCSSNIVHPKRNKALVDAIRNRDQDITVIYFCRKDTEKAYLEGIPGVHTFLLKKYSVDTVKAHMDDIIAGVDVSKKAIDLSGYADVSSDIGGAFNAYDRTGAKSLGDFKPVGDDMFDMNRDPSAASSIDADGFNDEPGDESSEDVDPLLSVSAMPEFPDTHTGESAGGGFDNEEAAASILSGVAQGQGMAPYGVSENKDTMRQQDLVKEAVRQLDVDALRTSITNNVLHRQLLKENMEYQSAVNIIEILDKEIVNIFSDTSLSHIEKLSKIRQICAEKTGYKAVSNAIVVEKFLSTIDSITKIAQDSVVNQLEGVKVKYAGLDVENFYFTKRAEMDALIADRLQSQIQLGTLLSQLQNVYLMFDEQRDKIVSEIIDDRPTKHEIVNSALGQTSEAFRPHNISDLVTKLFQGIEESRIAFSSVQKLIVDVTEEVFNLYDYDNKLITVQAQLSRLLQANRVEQAVIATDVLKYKLRGVNGPDHVGKTVTAVCMATALSRIDNVLLMDLSANPKIYRYLKEPKSLEEFYDGLYKDTFVHIARDPSQEVQIFKLQEAVKRNCAHFKWIYIITSPEEQVLNDWLYENALSMTFVTTASITHLETTKAILGGFTAPNTARHVAVVGAKMNPTDIIDYLEVDPFTTKMISIPTFPEIQEATLKGFNPCDRIEVLQFFTEVTSD